MFLPKYFPYSSRIQVGNYRYLLFNVEINCLDKCEELSIRIYFTLTSIFNS